MFTKYKYHTLLHLIIFMWGFTGILGVLIAFLALGISLDFMKKSVKIASKKELLKIFGVGVIVALHWMTFYTSIQLSTASLGILCLSTTTLHVTWLEPLFMKRKFSKLEFFFGLIVIYGIYFVSQDFNPKDYEALAYGLCSALFAALFSVFNARLAQDSPSYKITFYEMIAALVFLTVVLVVQGNFTAELFIMEVSDFLWLLFLGILCTSFAFLATIEVVKRLGAFTVSLSINLEPVYTILLAIFILKENKVLGSQFYVGAAIIVMVVIANAILKYYQKANERKKQLKVGLD